MPEFNKPTKMTILILLIIFGGLILWNIIRSLMIQHQLAANQPIAAVTVAKAKQGTWHPYLYAVGSLVAINGVAISTQAAGNVVQLNFESGQNVKKGDFLLQIDDRQEQAELQNNEAGLKLAEITYERNKTLVGSGAISKQAFDESGAKFQQALANVAQTQAIINYKHITAPFDGKLGIRDVNLGQYIKPGDSIVSLQSMNPLYVNFFLPEQYLPQLKIGQTITLKVDGQPNDFFQGKINALNSLVDVQTHNITIQATVPNNKEKLYPGLFARINVILPTKSKVILVPATAINYTLYGNTVFILIRQQDKHKKETLTVKLQEVETGEQRNGQIIVTKGLRAGEEIVTSGQLKLTDGQAVIINNSVVP